MWPHATSADLTGGETRAGQGAIRVMIVDDHAVVRSGLSAFLLAFDDLEYAGEATGGADAVRKCVSLKQDDLVQGALKAGALSHLMKKPGQAPAALRWLQSRRD